jgi:hypothetical protein
MQGCVPICRLFLSLSTRTNTPDNCLQVFDYLVNKINEYTEPSDGDEYGTISLLDIFGFESFAVNRFEQVSTHSQMMACDTIYSHTSFTPCLTAVYKLCKREAAAGEHSMV